ncbi:MULTISPECIES: HAD family hydrolase [unclassified Aureispira]|uniref:HAD family hydrolase n=1 Tax=unclassified Aureispira TaxID=2649989 RepID=UPI000695A636|nr:MULTISPECIES: HAD family hydrolase [unclassified Aureispira]WMX14014.1 HAD family hydrolase [Aureispira sp. CCB-E]
MKKTKLAIFDIDGTLTQTNEIDHVCYIDTVQKFITKQFDTFDGSMFKHFTDSSILIELYEHFHQRVPSQSEEVDFKKYYFEALNNSLHTNPHYFQAIEGAPEILHAFSDEWAVALATGCWVESAEIKLKGGGVDISNYPLATASDAITRQEVMLTAVERAKTLHQVEDFEHIVYIGDGLWDKHSCASLKMPFVGIDAENHALQTGVLGDFHLLANYTDAERVFELLEQATPPNL